MPREVLRGINDPNIGQDISNFSLGYNGYTSAYLLGPAQWAASSNVYSGQFATVRRARFCNVVVDGTTSGTAIANTRYTSLFEFRDATPQNVMLGDLNASPPTLWVFQISSQYAATQRINSMNSDQAMGSNAPPWQRWQLVNMVFEMNGFVKQKGRGTKCLTIENWGLDTPDTSPAVTQAVGAITSSGRSYRFAFENANIPHVSAPSPATSYIVDAAQQNTVDCIQAGTLNASVASTAVVGAGTAFSAAWIGRSLWIEGIGLTANTRVVAVADATHLTVAGAISIGGGSRFQIVDPQTTHLRLYATGDLAATYLRLQRNAFVPGNTTLAGCGLEFVDNSNTQPPSAPWTTEIAQFYNVPPPIGKHIREWQTRLIVFGVPGFPQSFFYSNIEATTIGDPPESFAPLNQVTLPIGDANLSNCQALPTGLVLWSDQHDMFKITGSLSDNISSGALQQSSTMQRLPYDIGSGSPYGAQVTPAGVLWITSDYEIRLYNDVHASRNVGRPVQDILNSINPAQLANARSAYYHRKDRNWYVIAIATGTNTSNNKLLILDIDLLSANGAPSFFLFDMATNQPAWYVFDISTDALQPVFDAGATSGVGTQRLMGGTLDNIVDLDYNGTDFKQGVELTVSQAFVKPHFIGNETATFLKNLMYMRFVTNTDPSALQSSGWSFLIEGVDDDFYTLAKPQTQLCRPGIDSPSVNDGTGALTQQRPGEFSPGMFWFNGVRFIRARRYRPQITFPSAPPPDNTGWELRSVMYKDAIGAET